MAHLASGAGDTDIRIQENNLPKARETGSNNGRSQTRVRRRTPAPLPAQGLRRCERCSEEAGVVEQEASRAPASFGFSRLADKTRLRRRSATDWLLGGAQFDRKAGSSRLACDSDIGRKRGADATPPSIQRMPEDAERGKKSQAFFRKIGQNRRHGWKRENTKYR